MLHSTKSCGHRDFLSAFRRPVKMKPIDPSFNGLRTAFISKPTLLYIVTAMTLFMATTVTFQPQAFSHSWKGGTSTITSPIDRKAIVEHPKKADFIWNRWVSPVSGLNPSRSLPSNGIGLTRKTYDRPTAALDRSDIERRFPVNNSNRRKAQETKPLVSGKSSQPKVSNSISIAFAPKLWKRVIASAKEPVPRTIDYSLFTSHHSLFTINPHKKQLKDKPTIATEIFPENRVASTDTKTKTNVGQRLVHNPATATPVRNVPLCQIEMVAISLTEITNLRMVRQLWNSTAPQCIPVIFISSIGHGDQFRTFKCNIRQIELTQIRSGNPAHSIIYILSQQKLHIPLQTENVLKSAKLLSVKNLAYLTAIALKATSIWEFDGDKIKIINPSFFKLEYIKSMAKLSKLTIHSHVSKVLNPYVIFGAALRPNSKTCQPSNTQKKCVSPRSISTVKDCRVIPTLYATTLLSYSSSIADSFKPGIVQTFLNRWPDTQYDSSKSCQPEIDFKSRLKHANLHPTQLTPISNRATLFFPETFWSLYLPFSVPENVADVWRGYISQTLMRCTGNIVMFHKPVIEATDICASTKCSWTEEDHSKTDILIAILDSFACQTESIETLSLSIPCCLKQVYKLLLSSAIIRKEDGDALSTWIETLRKINYVFPPFKATLCSSPTYFQRRVGMFRISPPDPIDLSSERSRYLEFQKTIPHILLIVVINFKHMDVIPLWFSIFQYIVPPSKVFYCTSAYPCHSFSTDHVICNVSTDGAGYYMYEATVDAMEKFPNFSLYVTGHDDLIFDPLFFETLLKSGENAVVKVTESTAFCIDATGQTIERFGLYWPPWEPWVKGNILKMLQDGILLPLINKYSRFCPRDQTKVELYRLTNQQPCLPGQGWKSDSYAVQAKYKEIFTQITKIFRKYDMFLEVVLPWTMKCVFGAGLKPENTIQFSHSRFFSDQWDIYANQLIKTSICQVYQQKSKSDIEGGKDKNSPMLSHLHVVHPIKLSGEYRQLYAALTLRECFTLGLTFKTESTRLIVS